MECMHEGAIDMEGKIKIYFNFMKFISCSDVLTCMPNYFLGHNEIS